MSYSLIMDILFAVLLVATIGYAMVLNRKLGNLRKHKEDLERLAATFGEATVRAEDSIRRLKGSTQELQADLAKAKGLSDDLSFLIERGTSTADRLEDNIRGARGETASGGSETGQAPRPGQDRPTPASRPASRAMGKRPADTMEEATAAAHAVAAAALAASEGGGRKPRGDGKSQAERDLLEALRQVR